MGAESHCEFVNEEAHYDASTPATENQPQKK